MNIDYPITVTICDQAIDYPKAEIQNKIYKTIIPQFEEHNILLTQPGNYAKKSPQSKKLYETKKQKKVLFNIEKIKEIYTFLDKVVDRSKEKSTEINELRSALEWCKGSGHYLCGDVIVAMILKGFTATFGCPDKNMLYPCTFNATPLPSTQEKPPWTFNPGKTSKDLPRQASSFL